MFLCYNLSLKNFFVTSDVISTNLNRSIIDVMNKDFKQEELKRFVKEYDGSKYGYPYTLEIYGVKKKGKTFKYYESSEAATFAYKNSEKYFMKGKDYLVYAYPLKLTENCMSCHQNEKVGDILAILTINYDLKPLFKEFNRKMIFYFFILFPIPLIFAFFLSRYISKKLRMKFNRLATIVENVNTVKDLKKVSVEPIDFGFVEFNKVVEHINNLTQKIRNFAVDKDILEFEIKILEKFIITSEVIKDWKETVKNLLLEVNKLMETYAIFSLFKVDDEMLSLEIFWLKKPSLNTIELTEKFITKKIKENVSFFSDVTDLRLEHNIADNNSYLKELTEEDIAIQTKSLILDAPRIGGVVGIGVHSEMAMDNIHGLVIEGILATLMNVVGSVKAMAKYTKQLEYYTTRDPLTNLFNQRVFWEVLGYEVGRASRNNYKFSILLVDIDNFKSINDSYGHSIGDYIISEMAGIIRQCLRKGDILARYSGDQFVAILPDAGEEQAFNVGKRIQDTVFAHTFKSVDDKDIRLTISAGIAIYPDHADNAKDLFIFADNVLKRAKDEGKNLVVIPTQEEVYEVFKAITEKTIIVTKAVNERRILPYFQPIIRNSTGVIECCEVLSRIDTPEGILNAYEFIEIAEKINLISRLDIILLENAIIEVVKSNFKGLLFVNLSPRSLVMSEFIPEVMRITKEYNFDRSRIVFEITERETVKNLSLLEKFIANLRVEGFKFAIDDFGSGFCSFQYLRRFPVDFIKIEGEFVRNILNDRKDHILVKTLSIIAREFDIKTIAEYVESKELLDEMTNLGITYSQGYFIGKPSPNLP
ncbi:EAL domain-containing protein [Calditerrivibrio sp.]|uniref:putative bifunctional diguanylate cyclase/phosphodiesterase n=1 Tax=Calditerrivibrio sp. TaxID=2792612 RepID=UPI003D0F4EF8